MPQSAFLPYDYKSDRVGRVDLYLVRGVEFKKTFQYVDHTDTPFTLEGCTLAAPVYRGMDLHSQKIMDFGFLTEAGHQDLAAALFTLYATAQQTAAVFEGKGFYRVEITDPSGTARVKQWGAVFFNF